MTAPGTATVSRAKYILGGVTLLPIIQISHTILKGGGGNTGCTFFKKMLCFQEGLGRLERELFEHLIELL